MKTSAKKLNGVVVKAGIKAGGITPNHNRRALTLTVKSGIKAGEGILAPNHSRRLA